MRNSQRYLGFVSKAPVGNKDMPWSLNTSDLLVQSLSLADSTARIIYRNQGPLIICLYNISYKWRRHSKQQTWCWWCHMTVEKTTAFWAKHSLLAWLGHRNLTEWQAYCLHYSRTYLCNFRFHHVMLQGSTSWSGIRPLLLRKKSRFYCEEYLNSNTTRPPLPNPYPLNRGKQSQLLPLLSCRKFLALVKNHKHSRQSLSWGVPEATRTCCWQKHLWGSRDTQILQLAEQEQNGRGEHTQLTNRKPTVGHRPAGSGHLHAGCSGTVPHLKKDDLPKFWEKDY